MRFFLVMYCLLFASPVLAQDFTIDPHRIDRCLPTVDDPMQCVGREAYDCIFRNGNGPNMVPGACYTAEAEIWDDFLNEAYQELLSLAGDLEASDSGWKVGELVGSLRVMQRNWIDYRNARCANALALAKPFGSRASAVDGFCNMRETAKQYFELRDMWHEYDQY